MARERCKKVVPGPGGMRCPCCCPMTPTKAKKATARRLRRQIRQSDLINA